MIRVLTFGVYDLLHIGHILLFKHIKELYPNEECYLIVAVQKSESILKYKPSAVIMYSTEERVFMVSSVRFVDEVVLYDDVDKDIMKFDFDVFVKGPDQIHPGFKAAEEWCLQRKKPVIVVPRTEGISSSLLRVQASIPELK